MIYARLENLKSYIPEEYKDIICNFTASVSQATPEGEYPMSGDKIFARVMSYDTKTPRACDIEAHNRYIDIQATIAGAEGISVYGRDRLTEEIPYDEVKDVLFFEKENAVPQAYTANLPGYFTMLFPDEAHRPQERIDGCTRVKKLVIKILAECVEDKDR